jgi:ferrochelatase
MSETGQDMKAQAGGGRDGGAKDGGGAPQEGGRIGVLLVNLGSPQGTDYRSMRRYLAEFLSDRRVIELPRILWKPILHGPLLATRPQKSAEKYRAIWDEENDCSPLIAHTRQSAQKLQARMNEGSGESAESEGSERNRKGEESEGSGVMVEWAMRYGQPSIARKLDEMTQRGVERLLIFPLYPQYSATTTASVMDAVGEALAHMRHLPAIRTVPPYYADKAYIRALAQSMKKELARLDFSPDVILASFHGIPQDYAQRGDPYPQHCETTHRLLRRELGEEGFRLILSYQSRMGPRQWLRPYTDETIRKLVADGVRNLAVITPGFAADCLETLEEIGIENRRLFLDEGGENFALLPCLNASAEAIDMLEAITRRELAGWSRAQTS